MIRTQLQTALTDAGCTLVLYESAQMATVITDQTKFSDIVGLVLEPDTITLESRGNGLHEHYPPVTVEVFQQVRPEDTAANNEATLAAMLAVCKAFVLVLIRSGAFAKIPAVPCTKLTERRYDANVLGWSMALDLQPLTNETTC
jgi:hypothetical protein